MLYGPGGGSYDDFNHFGNYYSSNYVRVKGNSGLFLKTPRKVGLYKVWVFLKETLSGLTIYTNQIPMFCFFYIFEKYSFLRKKFFIAKM